MDWATGGAIAGTGILGFWARRKQAKARHKIEKAKAKATTESKVAAIMDQFNDYLEVEGTAVSSAKVALATANVNRKSSAYTETLFDMEESYYKNKAQSEENKEFAGLEGNLMMAQANYNWASSRMANYVQLSADMMNAAASAYKGG